MPVDCGVAPLPRSMAPANVRLCRHLIRAAPMLLYQRHALRASTEWDPGHIRAGEMHAHYPATATYAPSPAVRRGCSRAVSQAASDPLGFTILNASFALRWPGRSSLGSLRLSQTSTHLHVNVRSPSEAFRRTCRFENGTAHTLINRASQSTAAPPIETRDLIQFHADLKFYDRAGLLWPHRRLEGSTGAPLDESDSLSAGDLAAEIVGELIVAAGRLHQPRTPLRSRRGRRAGARCTRASRGPIRQRQRLPCRS